jgi:hypothetical protein
MEQDHWVRDREQVVDLDSAHPLRVRIMDKRLFTVSVVEVFHVEGDEVSPLAVAVVVVVVAVLGEPIQPLRRITLLLYRFR